jgi:AcrR family transcriptional regulator
MVSIGSFSLEGRMIAPALANKLATLPAQPGVYLLKDQDGRVVYVGRADNLRRRVGIHVTSDLLARIADIEFQTTVTEGEALKLERDLIRQYRPQYKDLRKIRRVAERRIQIVEAAARVFAQKGFHQATTKEIAREAGIAEGTIYLYFENKEDVLVAVLTQPTISLFLEIVGDTESLGDDDEAILTYALQAAFAMGQQYADYLRLFLSAIQAVDDDVRQQVYLRLEEQLGPVFQSYVQQRIADGAFRDLDPQVVTQALVGMCLIFILTQELLMAKHVQPLDFDAVVPVLVDLFLHGVAKRET